jgi:FlaA1/EpsC-like NDP-sugar epimerase
LVGWQRSAVQLVFDGLCWAGALLFATAVRYDLNLGRIHVGRLLLAIPLAALVQALTGAPLGLYRGRWPFGGFDELAGLIKTVVTVTAAVFVVNVLVDPHLVPRSVPLGAGMAALVLMAGGRYVWRLQDERRRRPSGDGCRRLIVFGAGEAGSQIIRALLRNPASEYVPVAVLDDDPGRRNLRIMGVPVVGNRSRLAAAAEEAHADALLIALPSAPAALVTEIGELAASCGLPVKVLPPVRELVDCSVTVGDIRDISVEDLLGRHRIRTDIESIAGYVTGKRVLVTGAGGSIGSELCRQIYRFAPAELILLDRDESALHAVELSIYGRALMDSPDLVLVDLRDRPAVERVLTERRPQVIFHAAALKHLPLLERHPAEAVKTNVWATLDLLELAVATGVERFVNVSTDKAAAPCSVLGYTKRITERLTSYMAAHSATVCLSVRFGNVLGSRGSVLTTLQSQIERGGPVTVTDPNVTRYFMTVEEAVELVIQAGAIARSGEVLVLDMGAPVRIAEVAQLLAARAERAVTIQYTGLRGGEKLHEVLLAPDEPDRRPAHPLISQVAVAWIEPEAVRTIDVAAADGALTAQLAALCQQEQPARAPAAED